MIFHLPFEPLKIRSGLEPWITKPSSQIAYFFIKWRTGTCYTELFFRAIKRYDPWNLSLLSKHLKSVYFWLILKIKQNGTPKKSLKTENGNSSKIFLGKRFVMSPFESSFLWSGQVRSGHSVWRAHSEQAVVAHACHGHRYRSSPVPLSGTEVSSSAVLAMFYFYLFIFIFYGWMDIAIDGSINAWMDWWVDGRTDGRTDVRFIPD